MQHNNLDSNEDDQPARKRALSEPITAIIDEIEQSFDVIAAITLRHPLPKEEMHPMEILVHIEDRSTGMLDPMQHVAATEAVIDIKDGDQVGILYDIHISTEEPAGTETVHLTPVYRSDDVEHADPITIEDGLDRLRWKLGKTSDEIQSTLREEGYYRRPQGRGTPFDFPNLLYNQSGSRLQAMNDSVEDCGSGIVGQQEPLNTAESNVPDTDDDWFALIEPEIDVLPKEADEDDVIEVAQRHAEQAVERTGMAVDVDLVGWRATRELRAKHGYHRGGFIKLSIDSLETNGWQEFLRIVRHELVHAWQYQNDVDDRPGKNTFERFHGSSFEQWIPILNVAKRGANILPLWTIQCPDCQALLDGKQQARDKEIAQRIQTLDRKVCHECEYELSEYTVKRDGEEIPVDSLPDVLTDEQDQLFLYHEPATTAQPPKREWDPRTRRLTSFTGIGELTARRLGRNINRIDELLDADKDTLAAEVRSAVPGSYHESLRAEACGLYEKALAHRSTDDIELLDQVMSHPNYDWWKPIECLEGTGTVESMCLLLRDEIEPDDRLRITVENHGEYTAQVVATSSVEIPSLGVTIDPDSTPLGSQGSIEIPAPHRGENPTFRYRQDPPESGPTISVGTSGSTWVERREKIIEVEKHDSAP